ETHEPIVRYEKLAPPRQRTSHFGLVRGATFPRWVHLVAPGHKATLPLTIPRRIFKSSAKDSTRRAIGIALQGVPQGSSALWVSPTARASGGPGPLLLVGKRAAGARIASSPDSDLEAFSHNPTHGDTIISRMCRPSQTPHLTMSSARIDRPKPALGPKRGAMPRLRFTE
ncbi:hypothetical protein PIB30_105396, partial [Stylosanthes scabra]|nr:hypothetical protein [Stylosanthes scabra]